MLVVARFFRRGLIGSAAVPAIELARVGDEGARATLI